MFEQLIESIKLDKDKWTKFQEYFEERAIASKTTLLREGEISNHVHYIKQGC